ncbi:hypothetical protein, partial [Actinomyces bowdenii]
MAAEPTTQAFDSADETSAFPMPGGGQGYEAYAGQAGYEGQHTEAFPGSADPTTALTAGALHTEAFPGSADPTSAFPMPGAGQGYEAYAEQAGYEGQYTEAFPGSADPTSAFPAGAAHTSVMPAAGRPAAPGTPQRTPQRTTVMPAHLRPTQT